LVQSIVASKYACVLKAKNGGREITAEAPAFACTVARAGHGYLRISRHNPLYFEFEDGTPFCAVAMDKALGPVFQYERIYDRFAGVGGNFNRLFLTHSNFNIMERVVAAGRPDKGVGKLNLEYCWCVDQVLALGERLGVYHMLTLTNQTNFRTNNGGWDMNVYNAKNGGFLNTPGEYFTDERAQRVFENLLRYAVARWGASTSLFSGPVERGQCGGRIQRPDRARGTSGWHAICGRRSVKHVVHANFATSTATPRSTVCRRWSWSRRTPTPSGHRALARSGRNADRAVPQTLHAHGYGIAQYAWRLRAARSRAGDGPRWAVEPAAKRQRRHRHGVGLELAGR
jgi:hypothetical protein